MDEAQRVLNRVANLVTARERSSMLRDKEREDYELLVTATRQARDECMRHGDPPEQWPPEPGPLKLSPLEGISVPVATAVTRAVNGFVISRRFTDEFVAKKEVEALRERVLGLMRELEHYRQRVAELMARQQ